MKLDHIDEMLDALMLVRDCSSQEWQEADGRRMAATDNQGRRLHFIGEDVMTAVREAIAKANGEQ